MTVAPLTPRDAFDVLTLGRRVAIELAAEATDPARPLTMAVRRALADLAVTVDEAVAARAGASPLDPEARADLAQALDRIEAEQHPLPP